MLNQFGVKPRYTGPYRPQANGLCERSNGVIATILGKLGMEASLGPEPAVSPHSAASEIAKWGEKVPLALYYYNTKENTSIGKTPY